MSSIQPEKSPIAEDQYAALTHRQQSLLAAISEKVRERTKIFETDHSNEFTKRIQLLKEAEEELSRLENAFANLQVEMSINVIEKKQKEV